MHVTLYTNRHLLIIDYVIYICERQIPADAPWNCPRAHQLDRITFAQFIDDVCWTREAREFANIFMQVSVTSEPYEGSALWFLWYVKQCGGSRRIFSTSNGGQERKIKGGSQQISELLAARLGDRVRLSAAVVSLKQQNANATVTTRDGVQYRAKYVILAVPPAVQNKIHYEPGLGFLKNQLNQRMPMGTVMKCIVYYREAFWRKRGMCGSMMIVGDDEHPIPLTLDDTKPDGTFPAIIGFIVADKCRRLCTVGKDERKDIICRSFAKALGTDDALHVRCPLFSHSELRIIRKCAPLF